jgi:hypothetical protein
LKGACCTEILQGKINGAKSDRKQLASLIGRHPQPHQRRLGAQGQGRGHGRQPKPTHHQRQAAVARREAGASLVDIGRACNVGYSTITRL